MISIIYLVSIPIRALGMLIIIFATIFMFLFLMSFAFSFICLFIFYMVVITLASYVTSLANVDFFRMPYMSYMLCAIFVVSFILLVRAQQCHKNLYCKLNIRKRYILILYLLLCILAI